MCGHIHPNLQVNRFFQGMLLLVMTATHACV
jgi:hypothetical protein